MKQSCTLLIFLATAGFAAAATMSSATVSASTLALGGPPPCNMSSSGATVTCNLALPSDPSRSGTAVAGASASFGDLTAFVGLGATPPFSAMASATASFDQLLLLPGSGTKTIIGNYAVSNMWNGDWAFSNIGFGSINQAGTVFTLSENAVPLPLHPTSIITLGAPFDVRATLNLFGTAPIQESATLELRLIGFTDAAGNPVSPQLVTPEPQLAPILGGIVILIALRSRRRLRK